MTNLQKFAAQRLTKNQMNDVKGGDAYLHLNCSIMDTTTDTIVEYSHSVIGSSYEELYQNMAADLGENQVAVDCRGGNVIIV